MRLRPQIGVIAAVDRNRVIGIDNKIPWNYPGDLKRFSRLTRHTAVVMGRRTWESMGCKPLTQRRNIVVSRRLKSLEGIEIATSCAHALNMVGSSLPIWFIGGREVYREGIPLADVLDITLIPERTVGAGTVLFPEEALIIDGFYPWHPEEELQHPDEPALRVRRIWRISRQRQFEKSYDDPDNRFLQWTVGSMPKTGGVQ